MIAMSIIRNVRQKRSFRRRMASWDNRVMRFIKENNVPQISEKEFAPIREYWSKFLPVPIQSYFYAVIKASQIYNKDVESFPVDYHYISESIMYPYMMRKLNPLKYAAVYANKGMYGILFENINRPYEFLRICNGVVLDHHNNILTIENRLHAIANYDGSVIVKPGADSHGGAGVQILKTKDIEELRSVIDMYGANCIVQKLVEQSDSTARFNETSLNTFRILTLLLNGKVTVLARMLRCGAKDSTVDNVSSGGMIIDITGTGKLTRGVSFHQINIEKNSSGIVLRGETIDEISIVCEFAKSLHARIPLCAMVGWDIALDKDNNPVLLESNVMAPDTWVYQMLHGPIFGDRFDEVIDYVFRGKKFFQ